MTLGLWFWVHPLVPRARAGSAIAPAVITTPQTYGV